MSEVPIVSPVTPEEVVRQLRALRERIPDFTLLSRADSRTLAPAAAINDQLVHESINAIAASKPLQDALGRDAVAMRNETELIGRWSEVVVEVEAFDRGVRGSIRVRKHRLGGKALQVYQLSRQLARYKENAHLLPHIDAMKRVAKFPKRRAAQPQPGPLPGPQPEPFPLKKQ